MFLAPAALALRGDRDAADPSRAAAAGSALRPRLDSRLAPLVDRLTQRLERKRNSPLRYDKPREAQEFFALKRAPEGSRSVPSERYAAALAHMRSMPRFSTRLRQPLLSLEEGR